MMEYHTVTIVWTRKIVVSKNKTGANIEDSYHFFFDCSYYTNMRHTLFHNLSWLPYYCVLDLKLLTSDNPTLSNEQNKIIFKQVK